MRICISGEVLLRYPRQFCRLADSIINNDDEFFICTIVTEKNGNEIFSRVRSLCCPNTCSSFLVSDPTISLAKQSLEYLREYDILLYITNNREEADYIKKNSDILALCLV